MSVRLQKKLPIDRIEFVGGRLCLDFVNTANWVDGNPLDERLADMSAIAMWTARQGIAGLHPPGGRIEEFLELRCVIHRVLSDPENATSRDLAVLNRVRMGKPAPLSKTNGGLKLLPKQRSDWLRRLLADSAVEVALTVKPERLKTCSGDHCGWMFVDESPNNRRRWCSMATCGNRAKAKRHYAVIKNSG